MKYTPPPEFDFDIFVAIYDRDEWDWADEKDTLAPVVREHREQYLHDAKDIMGAYIRFHGNTALVNRLKAYGDKVYNRVEQIRELRALALAKGMTAEGKERPVKPPKKTAPNGWTG